MDAIRLRLRADVPVASYLSGGLDSSLISALVKKYFNDKLQTFSVSFTDKSYDESSFQKQMAKFIGTRHREITCSYEDIGRIMPEIVWHAEKPLIRTAPAPLFLLSKLVRDSRIKVVLTGEGADEILAGYDLFREMKIRRFWAKNPDSKFRSALFSRLYQYIPNWPQKAPAYLASFYKANLCETDKTYYSHIPRWNTTCQVKQFFSNALKQELKDYNCIDELQSQLPGDFNGWDYLSQAQYLEIVTLLSGNLLSSQGDRMMMAHSVEGRFPFLDYRVIEFCVNLPANIKLKGLKEKYILKKIAKPFLPEAIPQRQKQAYSAPDSASFFNGNKLDYIDELLSEENLAKTGYFSPTAVSNLVNKCKTTDPELLGARYNMAIVGIITTLLLDKMFVSKTNYSLNTNRYTLKT
jgi:asparagine synthase (glutamine-hydrolysing)